MAKEKKSNSVDTNYLGDEKLEKGKKNLVDQSSTWRGSRKEEQPVRDTKKILKGLRKEEHRHAEKVSWRKKAAGIGAITFLCGVGLYNFVSTVLGFVMGTGVARIDVQDTATLKNVLFGGDPWLVYCVNNETENLRLPRVLEDSARDLSRSTGVRVGVVRCWDQTQSGRSVAQRFKLNLKPPLSFVVANGNKPRVLDLLGISKAEDLEKRVKPALEVKTYRIDTLKKWSSLCTSRRSCVVVGHRINAQRDTAVTLLRPLLDQFRAIKLVTLDTSFWQLKLEDELLATRPAGKSKEGRADVLCLAREESAGNTTFGGKFLTDLDASKASSFMKACAQHADLVKIQAAPRIKARPTKPKKVEATPSPTPSPRPSPTPASRPKRANVDHVGSRAQMESEDEALFEALDEDEQQQVEAAQEEEENEEGADEVEL